MLQQYLNDLFKTAKAGDAREESYYPDLKKFLENCNKNKKFHVTSLPKKTEAGNPDYRVWDGKQHIVGYIEAKDPKINLDSIETSEQLTRYRGTFPNLILTNFFEFRLYRNGQRIDRTIIGQPFALIHKISEISPAQNQNEFTALLAQFFSFSIPQTYTAKQLAIELAKRTRFLRDQVIKEELKEEKVKGSQTLEGFYKAFKDHLIATLTLQDFSNLFAQTITYGLFAARSRADKDFNRKLAHDYIPHTIGILRDVFRFISSTDLPQSMEWITDDIAEVLAVADVKKIISSFYKEAKGKDPIIHFYETFLTEYDPKERGKRGVYYTPEPVVGYIVRSIHQLLKEKFNKEDGFATQSVTVLDPAAGTLTFPAETIKLAVEEYQKKYGSGGIKSLIKDHILKNFYAFELMMAPYAVGHLKIGFLLNEYGYRLNDKERFKLYLTNSLEFQDVEQEEADYPGLKSISHESKLAGKVKRETPILVIFGNPPYSVSSSNQLKPGTDFYKFYETYKERVRKEERNIQPLSDDYIKFIAFAHWKIKQAGHGIIGMITNNSYLDGLIHRDIRRKLLEDFNEIYILNLHGNLKRQEINPKGGKDENVFDIQQGVGIILLVKCEGKNKVINYFDKWGLREEKYEFLNNHDIKNTDWKKLTPVEPHNFLISKNFTDLDLYQKFLSLKDIFIQYKAGIATGKDDVLIDFGKQSLIQKLDLDKDSFELIMQNQKINKELIERWFNELNSTNIEDQIKQYSYRPFDNRYVIYNTKILQRARESIMKNMLQRNIALVTSKQLSTNEFSHVFVTDTVCDRCLISLQTREVSYIFPLRIYNNDAKQEDLFESDKKIPDLNFSTKLWEYLEANCEVGPTALPEDIFCYIYAVLYSNVYRKKYQEFLKIDFPRIPFVKSLNTFKALAQLGEQLVNLHLLKSRELNNPIAKFSGKSENENRVEKREFNNGKVFINDHQFFENIKPEIWNYNIGGYQVLDKWLKDRKGRPLSAEDIKHYCQIVTSLEKTIEIQKQIDKIYPIVEKEFNK